MTTPLEEKTNFQPKITPLTRPLWQNLINTFKNETLDSCSERKFGFTLNESRHTLASWIVTVIERAVECKFSADFYEEAVKEKLAFSCKEETYELKLYDEGAALSLEKAMKFLSLKEVTKPELQKDKNRRD